MNPLCVDLGDWGQIAVRGDDRARFLHGMCTSDVEGLADGAWVRSSILTAKGRLVSIVEIAARGDHHVLICQPGMRDSTIEFLDGYAMVDDVEFAPTDGPLHKVWADPAAVWDAPPEFSPPPGPVASAEEVETRRIEAGYPLYGIDVTDKNFPFETPLDRHIDYQKGCYIGQEPVARVKSRGSASKYLRGLRIEGDTAVSAGAAVDHPERAGVAKVTSAAMSADFGAIALALMPRLAWQPGTRVEVEGRAAEVVALPFSGDGSC